MRTLYAALLCLTAIACGEDPVSVSDVVDTKLSVSSGGVQNGVLFADKNINTEPGNPYGVFLQSARDQIGADPSRISVTGAALMIDTTSNNVTTVGGVFLGVTTISFIMNGSITNHSVASRDVQQADGAGAIAFAVDFDSDDLSTGDFSDLVTGSFKVKISGAPATSFSDANADANMVVSLTFSAFE